VTHLELLEGPVRALYINPSVKIPHQLHSIKPTVDDLLGSGKVNGLDSTGLSLSDGDTGSDNGGTGGRSSNEGALLDDGSQRAEGSGNGTGSSGHC
jgi:hypothetical protein